MQFKWYQNPNTITITFQVPANTQKAGIDVQCNGTTIKGGSKGSPSLCEGILYSQVKLPFKWDISSGKVIVSLEKVNKVRWPQIFDGKKRVKAQYDYDAQDAEELTFKENDILVVLKEDPTGWWKGELNGQVGTFPVNFVEQIPDVVAPPESPEPPTSTPQPAPTPAPIATEPEPVENPESEESQSLRVAMPGMTASADGTDAMAELKNRLQKRNPGQGPQIDELVKNRKQENQPPPEFPNKDQLKKRVPEKSTDAPPPSTGPAPVKLPIATKTGVAPLPVKKAPIKNEVAPPVKNDAPAKQPSKVSSFPVKKTEEAEKSSFLRKSEADAEPEPPKKVALTRPPKPAPHKQIKVRAAFQYDVQDEGELGFLVGDIIEIKTKSDSGWWQGELNGLVGWFPASFVEDYVEAPIEQQEPKPTENSTETSKNSSSDEDVGSKLSEIVSDAPRLAAPKRVGGASGRRAPSRRKPGESAIEKEKPKSSVAKPEKQATPTPIVVAPVKEPVKNVPPPVKQQPAEIPAKVSNRTKSVEEPMKSTQAPPLKSSEQPARVQIGRPIATSGNKNEWPSSLPPFSDFCKQLVGIFEGIKGSKGGNNSSHYLHLNQVDSEAFGFAVVGVDGNRFSHGSSDYFSLHGAIWPFLYGIALETIGEEKALSIVGTEVTPAPPHSLLLNGEKKPHNPFINSGAMLISNELYSTSEGYQRISHVLEKLSGIAGTKISCSMPSYLSMCESADRDLSLGYWLVLSLIVFSDVKRSNLNSKISDPKKMLDFFFQISSIETNCLVGAQLAATLASEGVSPITGAKGLDSKITKKLVSLLHSCGMNDESSHWIEQVGICAKSSVTGCILLVIPKVCGICVYSPRIDAKGTSVRGFEFCKQLSTNFGSLSGFKF